MSAPKPHTTSSAKMMRAIFSRESFFIAVIVSLRARFCSDARKA